MHYNSKHSQQNWPVRFGFGRPGPRCSVLADILVNLDLDLGSGRSGPVQVRTMFDNQKTSKIYIIQYCDGFFVGDLGVKEWKAQRSWTAEPQKKPIREDGDGPSRAGSLSISLNVAQQKDGVDERRRSKTYRNRFPISSTVSPWRDQ